MIDDCRQYFPKSAIQKLAKYLDFSGDKKLLPFRIQLLTFMAACQAIGRPKVLKGLLRWALKSDIDPGEIYEILLQGHLFIGYPKAIESFFIFNEIMGGEKEGVKSSCGDKEDVDYDLFKDRGLKIAEQIYGKNFKPVYDNIRHLSSDLASGMIIEGYGRIISRPGLDLLTRELAIVAVLTVTFMPRQLYSHIKGSLNAGANSGQIRAIIKQNGYFVNPSKVSRALVILEKVLGNIANPR